MKKIWLVLLALSCFALMLVHAAEVSSVNVVGYKKVTLPPTGMIMKNVPFDAFDATLLGVFGTNQLVKGGDKSPGTADRIWIWSPSKPGYDSYAQKASDQKFYNTTNWSGVESTLTLQPGEGFWLMSSSAATNEITLMGEVVVATTQQIFLVEGMQQVGYPFSSEIALQDADFANDGAVGGGAKAPGMADRIWVWDPVAGYSSYAYKIADGQWYSTTNWSGAPTPFVIGLADGFWFQRMTNASFTWSETNKYLSNL